MEKVEKRAKREKGKGKRKVQKKRKSKYSLVMNKHKISNGGQKRTLLGGPEDSKRQERLVKRQ